MLLAAPALAEDVTRKVPLSDTEDASISLQTVGTGRLHPIIGLDLRNGDYVRGTYDDDGAGLGRVPVHAQFGLVYDLGSGDREPATWLEVRSSNGFHAPNAREAASPRAWYESNNLIGLATRIAPDAIAAISYAIKTSPNGGSGTTHEISAAMAWQGQSGLGLLHPGFAATWRPKGGGGLYTQVTATPGIGLGTAGRWGRLSVPMTLGIGWGGFYGQGSGRRMYGSIGIAADHPFTIGQAHLSVRAEASALIRDDRLRGLDPPSVDRSGVRPYTLVAVSYAL